MNRVLITGGAGYIGSVLTEYLLRLGHHVTVLDDFRYGQTGLSGLCQYSKLRIVRGDCRNSDILESLVPDADYIFPLAAIVGAPACDANNHDAWTINYGGVEQIVSLCKPHYRQKIIAPNTNSGYGIGGQALCTEDSPLNPISVYGQTKCSAEKIVLRYGNSVVFRLATVFGTSPRMRFDLLVNDFVRRAVKDRCVVLFEPHFRRNFVHIRDVVGAFIFAMNNFDKMKGEVYNLGLDSCNINKLELCKRIKNELPDFTWIESPVGEDPDKRDYIVSNEKLRRAGFEASISLEEGIREVAKACAIYRDQNANA